jgi:hypothetical protein
MKLKIFCLLLISQLISMLAKPMYAADCEIVSTLLYHKEQPVIAQSWNNGIPYKQYKIETYPCADIKLRNTFWQSLYSTDIEVTATFTDQSTRTIKIECEKKLLESNEEFSCSLCFESAAEISSLECRFR